MNFQFDLDTSQLLVDGILQGNQNYYNERIAKKREMAVSAAYAFTRGNHIDSAIHQMIQTNSNISSEIKHAGHFWEYASFPVTQGKEKYLLIVKHQLSINRAINKAKATKSTYQSYLVEFAEQYNKSWISDLPNSSVNEQVVLELYPNEINCQFENLKMVEDYKGFFILVYTTDNQTHLVTEILLTALHPTSLKLINIQNLSEYIQSSEINTTAISDSFSEDLESEFDVATFPYELPDSTEETASN